MTDDKKMVCVQLPAETAAELQESVELDEGFDNQSELLRHLIDRWLAGEVW